jgi:hypothetical protein
MFWDIVTNVGNRKKPWEDVPIEVLIEEERKHKEAREDKRERLYAPMPMPPEAREPVDSHEINEHEDDFKIVIKL